MDYQEAALDKNRPLSITPREWMHIVESAHEEERQLIDETAERLSKDSSDSDVAGLVKVDIGLDQVIQGVKIVYSGLSDLNREDLGISSRRFYNSFKGVFDTAIVPYLIDALKLLEDEDGV